MRIYVACFFSCLFDGSLRSCFSLSRSSSSFMYFSNELRFWASWPASESLNNWLYFFLTTEEVCFPPIWRDYCDCSDAFTFSEGSLSRVSLLPIFIGDWLMMLSTCLSSSFALFPSSLKSITCSYILKSSFSLVSTLRPFSICFLSFFNLNSSANWASLVTFCRGLSPAYKLALLCCLGTIP